MSRARPIVLGEEEEIWFDTKINGEKAKASHLELLALVENLDLDDLLDEHITQGKVIERLRDALGQNGIPEEILRRREKWRQSRRTLPKCRICGEEEDSTKHHFVNKWILKELEHYASKWADRSINTVPICVKCHRNLHMRESLAPSMVPYLEEKEKSFVQAALDALSQQRPHLALLIAKGDNSVYEARLLKDYINGDFKSSEVSESSLVASQP